MDGLARFSIKPFPFKRFSRSAAGSLVSLLLAATVLAGCKAGQPHFTNVDLTGNTAYGSGFSLPDTNGKLRTLADFKGQVVVLVFGYTHCPDICPTTLADLTQSLQQLGDMGKRVQVLFVTVDPKRDTARILDQYVKAFNPSFIGLRPANITQLKTVTSAFRVYYAYVPDPGGSGYTVNHSPVSFVFDTHGRLRLYVRDAQGPQSWTHDLKLLLQ